MLVRAKQTFKDLEAKKYRFQGSQFEVTEARLKELRGLVEVMGEVKEDKDPADDKTDKAPVKTKERKGPVKTKEAKVK